MRPSLLGIDPKWNSLLPLVLINVVMLSTVVVFAFVYKRRPRDNELVNRGTSKFVSSFFYEYWGWVIAPFENLFIRLKLTPNFITTLGFLISASSGFAFATGHFGIAGSLMIIGGTCDMFDGRIARKTGTSSKSGAFYDSVMDRFGEAVVYVGLGVYYHDSWVLYAVLATLVGSTMVSYTRAKGDSVGVECKVGAMQRPERIVYLGVASIFSPPFRQVIAPRVDPPVEYLAIAALIFIGVMTILTSVYRMIYIFRKLRIAEGHPKKDAKSPIIKKLTHRYLDI